MRERGTCQVCRHSAVVQQFGEGQFVCRLNPPQVVGIVVGMAAKLVSLYPCVDRASTCGQFAPEAEDS